MIEATCTTCGTVNRAQESELPAGARFLTCTSCKSRVGLPAFAVPQKTPTDLSALAAARPSTSRPQTPRAITGGAGRPSSPAIDLDFMPPDSLFSGADLPAPKGALPPRSAAQPSKADITDLPAPKVRRTTSLPEQPGRPSERQITDLPAPKPRPSSKISIPPAVQSGPVSRPPPRPLLDLPAPRSRGIGELPPSAIGGIGDLPAPKRTAPPEPIESIGSVLDDLPPPPVARPSDAPDLPGPRRPSAADLPVSRRNSAADLPAPRPGRAPDLSAPKAGGAAEGRRSIPDLPAPKLGATLDLPAPKHAGVPDPRLPKEGGPADLPAPRPAGAPDLAAPRPGRAPDLPAPKGFFDDLPQPVLGGSAKAEAEAAAEPPAPVAPLAPAEGARGAAELPAPKGFFDDLPGHLPATKPPPAEPPAPKGFFDDLPGRPDATRPKPAEAAAPTPAEAASPLAIFDDLPAGASATKPPPAEAPPPKGLFDDLPSPPAASKPAATSAAASKPAASAAASKPAASAVASKPAAARPAAPELAASSASARAARPTLAGKPAAARSAATSRPAAPEPGPSTAAPGVLDDLPQPPRAAPSLPSLELDLSETPTSGAHSIELELESDGSPSLDLGPPPANRFDRLGPTQATARITPLSMSRVPSGATPASGVPTSAAGPKSGGILLELAEPRKSSTKLAATPAPAEPVETTDGAERTRRIRLIAIASCVLLGLSASGFFLYRRHAQQEARRAAITEQLAASRSAFGARDPKHWERAAAAALQVLELEPRHAAAAGLAAEALLADSIAYGLNATAKAARARALLATALSEGLAGPELERAQALAAATTRQPDLGKLEKLAAGPPQDPMLSLYLGWASAARGDLPAAIKAFTVAATAEPLKILALYGSARAKLGQADLPGARSDFNAILTLDRDNLPAQVGLASAMTAAQAQEQEAALLAILQRKDLAAGDPRAVTQAWVLAAEAARRAGRLEPARERYRKAQAIAPQDPAVMAGLAEIEILDGKLESAGDLIDKALAIDPAHVRAQLVSAELAIRHKRLDEATSKLQQLRTGKPAISTLEQARLALLTGKLAEANGQDMPAADAYVQAAKLAGDLDLTPALTAVAKLGSLAEAAQEAKEPQRAAVLRARAEQIISGFAEQARHSSPLAFALGMAFVQAGDAEQAEPWLRLVVEAKPSDAEVRYQLARALARLGRTDDAIAELQRASKLDEGRAEIAIELARIHEAAHRDAAAGEVFVKLLAAKDPAIEVRASAGRFFARHGQIDKAAEQGELIQKLDPAHPAGLYLRAEGALAAGKVDEAVKLFRAAVDADRDPQYLDGQGRAAEVQAKLTGELKFQDVALRAYIAAATAAPMMLNPLIGQGRIYVERRDASKAIPPLLAASKLAPDHPDVARLIGLAYQEISERHVAVEWLARAYRLEPSAETAWHLGQLYIEINAPRDALAALTNATRLALDQEKQSSSTVPWLTEGLYRLGRILMDAGNERAAKVVWEKYVGRNPKPGAQLEEVKRELATTLQRY